VGAGGHDPTMQLTPAERAEWDAVIDAEVSKAPPLTPEQIARLSVLFDYQDGDHDPRPR
jgi:hypothetical protein